ncbi:MAG TPA: bifunctional 4-hydroxy-3-methylbut-2-enyl diphosphate reductase/30S ribosomal protein S1 [Bacillota bacterium]|nr:bifunctional 4-hydroxy-3-methylbut-2-enyl diphosphate reductase/30S ribosomal protein S1 [Bacillota bacterium]
MKRMEIILDENAGFCFGVKNAVDKAFKEAEKKHEVRIFTYGPLIHNRQVISKLAEQGIDKVDDIEDIRGDEVEIIIRSHGIAEEKYRQFEEKGLKYVDCTCPYVSAIHRKVKDYYQKGYKIFIVGDKTHPEVIGTNGWCGYSAQILEDEITVDKLPIYDKICLVAQTTITKKIWDRVVDAVRKKYKNAIIFNTICNATEKRQESAEQLSKTVDCMIVIGSTESSNTNKLYYICKENCNNTYHIENAKDLPIKVLKIHKKIGITAGASTPDWVIKEVIEKMQEINDNVLEDQGNTADSPESDMDNQENTLDIPENDTDNLGNEADSSEADIDNQESMLREYEKTMRSVYPGDTVNGTVIMVTDDEVMVNIGYKSDGIIKKEDYTWEPDLSLKDLIEIGDVVEVVVVSINDGEGNVVLSKKLFDAKQNWVRIEAVFNENAPIEGLVKEIVKGGAIVEIIGIRAFMPASQFDIGYSEDLSSYVNTRVMVNVIEFNREKGKVIVSRKALLKKEREIKAKALWESIEAGQKLTGEVKRLTNFGAFVDIGGVDGLIHISELSWSRVKHPSEVVKPGDKVEVVVLGVDIEKKKISLGLKQTIPEPWSTVKGKYNVGDILEVKVLRFSNFGAFVEIEPGIDGLIHISQISDKRISKPSEALNIGDIVSAKITDIKSEEKKISLSIKELKETTEE